MLIVNGTFKMGRIVSGGLKFIFHLKKPCMTHLVLLLYHWLVGDFRKDLTEGREGNKVGVEAAASHLCNGIEATMPSLLIIFLCELLFTFSLILGMKVGAPPLV